MMAGLNSRAFCVCVITSCSSVLFAGCHGVHGLSAELGEQLLTCCQEWALWAVDPVKGQGGSEQLTCPDEQQHMWDRGHPGEGTSSRPGAQGLPLEKLNWSLRVTNSPLWSLSCCCCV